MFVLGHVGVGRAIVVPWLRSLPLLPFAFGALLPDVIDKPLYYARLSPYISCTRTFGHTLLLVACVLVLARLCRSRTLGVIGVAMTTHIAIDCLLDWNSDPGPKSAVIAALWPAMGGRFADVYLTLASHVGRLLTPQLVVTELAGAAVLAIEAWRTRWWSSLRSSRR